MSHHKTEQNLADAFAGESQANRRYLAFAKKADKEGYSMAAKLFRAAADAETVHALNHLRVLGEVKSTSDNLETAIYGETLEFDEMYPKMIKEAQEEGQEQALQSFNDANQVEEIHAELYKKYLNNLGNNPDTPIFVCQVCGNTVEGEAPESCPICGSPKSKFNEIE